MKKEQVPKIVIKPNEKDAYKKLDWRPYVGKDVEVVYQTEKRIIVSQRVTSIDIINSEDAVLAGFIGSLIPLAKKEMDELYRFAEAGRWAIRGKNFYPSNVFTSYSVNSIKPQDAFPSLVKIMREALSKEREDDLKGIVLAHTHPIQNAPLSPEDCNTVRKLAKELEMDEGEIIQVIAVPIGTGNKIIFRYDLRVGGK